MSGIKYPSRHKRLNQSWFNFGPMLLNQCWFNVGPTSETVDQR